LFVRTSSVVEDVMSFSWLALSLNNAKSVKAEESSFSALRGRKEEVEEV